MYLIQHRVYYNKLTPFVGDCVGLLVGPGVGTKLNDGLVDGILDGCSLVVGSLETDGSEDG